MARKSKIPRRSQLATEPLEPRCMLAANPMISEFMASNDSTLNDGNGNSSDWIEIHNSGDETADLSGWFLTDDITEPDKWAFPNGDQSNLASGEYLVVFASGDSAADAAGNLHTNFKLSSADGYLGLYQSDLSLVNQFADDGGNYPSQRQDISYGLEGGISQDLVLDSLSPARILIPPNNNLGLAWTANDFNAALNGFASGLSAIGYENSPGSATSYSSRIASAVASGTTTTYVRTQFNLDSADEVTGLQLGMMYDDGFIAYLNGTEVAAENDPASPGFDSVATASHADDEALVSQPYSLNAFLNLLVDGTNTLAIHALNRPSSSDFLMSPTLSIQTAEEGTAEPVYMTNATPGGPNASGFAGFVTDVVVSHDRGIFEAAFDLTLSTDSTTADIYYTFDGSEPSPTNGTLYSAPITISTTETVRATAFETGLQPSDVETHTYVFLDDVFTQNPRNNPKHGLTYPQTWQGGVTGDYTIDSRVVSQWNDLNPADPDDFGIREGLKSIPSISLVMDHDDLWGSNGIYPDATRNIRHGGSVEYFDPATGEQFQYDVGIQMQGAASRDNARLLKHSFRLVFNADFGAGRLNFPLFDNSDFSDINTVSLKASFTDAFATRSVTNRYSPLDSLYMRDVWMRDAQLAMGSLSADSTYAHLYINGLYWGLYWPTERVDDAFLASRLGGEREDWDIVRDFNELFRGSRSAYDQMMNVADQIAAASPAVADDLFQQIQGNNPDGSNNPSVDALLDVDNFIDYIALHLYAGVEDWPGHNWYAARNRVDPGKGFQFFTWDQEISLDQLYRDRTEANNNNTPGELFQDLQRSAEFRLRFADRVQKHLFNDGALTTAAGQERLMWRSDQIEAAIIGESARWGDAREGQRITAYNSLGPFNDGHIPTGQQTVPLMTVDHWRDARDYVHDNFLVKTGDLLISRLQSDGLFTSVDAPQLAINGTAQHGGLIVDGDLLSITGPGQIYYTVDGTDPRALGGAVQGPLYNSPIPINATTQVFARSFSGGQWSALTEATFTVSGGGIVISEINYHPYAPTTAAEVGYDKDDFEFVEVFNAHPTNPINLLGMRIDNGVDFTFGNETLAPGEYAVVVRNQAAFAARYGNGINVLGEYSGGLNNSGEQVDLRDGLGTRVMSVDYNDSDPWSKFPDGVGATLQLVDSSSTPVEELGKSYRWDHSFALGGSPGTTGGTAQFAVINEVLANSDAPQLDAIEIYNPTPSAINIGGWYLSDSSTDLLKFQIPLNTTLGIGEFIVFDENDFNDPGSLTPDRNFALSATNGDSVYLVVPNSDGTGPLLFVDDISFDASFSGLSYGRSPDGFGRLATMTESTLGSANSDALVGPLVISELNYHPAPPTAAALSVEPALTESDLEFVEIHNPTSASIDLTNWRLRGEADFDFAAGTTLAPLESLVLVSFNPNSPSNVLRNAAFLAQYQTTASLVGPYTGAISNGGGRVTLQRPDAPIPPNAIPNVLADELFYDDLAPWPVAVDGTGPSLHRVGPTFYGNGATSWRELTPSPGSVNYIPIIAGDYDRNGIVEQNDYEVWLANFNSTIAINADGNGDGIVDAADYTIWRDNSETVTLAASFEFATTAVNHNVDLPADVDGNGAIEPIDALLVLNTFSNAAADGRLLFADVSATGQLSPLDALRVINALNEVNEGDDQQVAFPIRKP